MRNLMIEGEVLVSKATAISKIVHLSFITTVPHAITNQLNNIQKNFIWNEKIQKRNIRHFQIATKIVV